MWFIDEIQQEWNRRRRCATSLFVDTRCCTSYATANNSRSCDRRSGRLLLMANRSCGILHLRRTADHPDTKACPVTIVRS